ncbi:MAG: dephospho-CoA kinase [Planctomycetota bacterium]
MHDMHNMSHPKNPNPMLPVIGLTGGIASGKSEVGRFLADLGCLVVNSDQLGHEALRDDIVRKTLVSWWGESIVDDSGELDRSAIARIVFSSPGERQRLEALVHPWIEARRRALFDDPPTDTRALVIDAPLLLEAGLGDECDAVIFVDADRSIRAARVQATRGWTVEDLERRESAQFGLDEKRKQADYVVVNEGDRDSLRHRVQEVLDDILTASEA